MVSHLKSVTTALLAIGSITWNVGCGPPDNRGRVVGTVTLDGQPLENGVARFFSVTGDTPTASAEVTDGEFSAEVPIGRLRVEFSAAKIVGTQQMYGTADSPIVDVVEELIPAKYNVRSELTLDVEHGSQKADFALESRQIETKP